MQRPRSRQRCSRSPAVGAVSISPARRWRVRSVIEVSNICQQGCKYCNMGLKSKQEKVTIGYEGLLRLANFFIKKVVAFCCCSPVRTTQRIL